MKKTTLVLGGKTVYANPNSNKVRISARGIWTAPAALPVSKGERRQLRKGLRAEGFRALAAC